MTNLELVEYAKKCLNLGDNSVYVYGTYGKTLTTSLCDSKHKQYPNINTDSRTKVYKSLCDGKHIGFDCVGLIKSFYWGGYPNPGYNANSDVSANGMYERAKVKGNINTLDKSRVGLLVQMNGHIGIYIGNDEVIECTISTYYAKQKHGMGGVCKTKLSDRKWEHWCECPYIEYVKNPDTKPIGTLEVLKGTWNVRKGAGINYDVVKVVKGGDKLNYYGVENNWYKVDGGYISSKAVKVIKDSFLPPRGYIMLGDSGNNVDALSKFMYKTFPLYTDKKALGNYYGKYIESSIKEFQRRTGLTSDGCVGPITYNELQKYGFKY